MSVHIDIISGSVVSTREFICFPNPKSDGNDTTEVNGGISTKLLANLVRRKNASVAFIFWNIALNGNSNRKNKISIIKHNIIQIYWLKLKLGYIH